MNCVINLNAKILHVKTWQLDEMEHSSTVFVWNKGNDALGVHMLLIFKRQHGIFGWLCWIPIIIDIYETLYVVLIHDVGQK